MTYRPDPGDPCPDCGVALVGLATKCWTCGWALVDHRGPAKRDVANDAYRGPERELRMAVRTALGCDGWTVWDFEQGYRKDGSTRVPRGTPDLGVQGFGLFAWVELKNAKGSLSAYQRDFQAQCAIDGIPYYVVRSVREARETMERLRRERAA